MAKNGPEMEQMELPRGPSPWVSPMLTAIGVVGGFLVWPYIQIRLKANPGADEMTTWVNVVITYTLGIFLAWAAVRNLRDARRAKRLEAAMRTVKDEHKTQLEYHTRQAEESQNAFRSQLANFSANKQELEVWKMKALQAQLAADDLRQQNSKHVQFEKETAGSKKRLDAYEQVEREREAKRVMDAELEQRAPAIEITYHDEDNGQETLMLKNDGPQTARNISIGPLRWSDERLIQLSHPPPPIPSKYTEPCPVIFHDKDTGNTSLFDFVRRRTPSNATVSVRVGYSDSRRLYNFRRDYTLSTYADGKFLWQPGPVKLRDAGDTT
jgi:hypothetical protein